MTKETTSIFQNLLAIF